MALHESDNVAAANEGRPVDVQCTAAFSLDDGVDAVDGGHGQIHELRPPPISTFQLPLECFLALCASEIAASPWQLGRPPFRVADGVLWNEPFADDAASERHERFVFFFSAAQHQQHISSIGVLLGAWHCRSSTLRARSRSASHIALGFPERRLRSGPCAPTATFGTLIATFGAIWASNMQPARCAPTLQRQRETMGHVWTGICQQALEADRSHRRRTSPSRS